jgi:hypothetical protein
MDKPQPDEGIALARAFRTAAELHAIIEISRALEPLTAEARARVLAKLRAEFDEPPFGWGPT